MSKKQVQPPEKQPEAATDQVTIVGIGASAGGLEALRAMLPNLPTEANLAFIIVQHLDPTHRSMLTTLLARYTELEVIEVVNGDTVEAHKVYITPSGKDITIRNGRLHLSEPAAEVGPKPSIDQFLTSLAEDQIERSVGVILSGTGSDGAHGMRAIKAEGGITVVQSEESARYTGMPRAAIQTGLIDLILPPEKIGPELIEILKYPQVTPEAAVETVPGDSLPTIFHLLLDRTGCDFSDYKLSTIRRRIERRMAVHKLTDLQEYTLYLERSPAEVELLFKDILISVTSFFRDPDAFRGLRKVLRKIIDNKKVSEDIRIWVPGCATGEEAYSIAILLAEELGEHINRYNIQIFGTDIDLDAISLARRGVYPEAVVIDMDRPLRDRYFVREDSSFRVIKLIREMVIFSRQDLTKDPPFSRLDLITCRNVLIYFNNILQKKLIPMFHYVLLPGAFLLLGKSETVGQFESLFIPVNKKWKIYQRRAVVRSADLDFVGARPPVFPIKSRVTKPPEREVRLRDMMNQAVADEYGFPGVLIDDRLEIVHVQGDIGPFLSLPPGDADLNILSMARRDIRVELRTLIHKASREEVSVIGKPLNFTLHDQPHLLTIRVRPVPPTTGNVRLTMLIFESTRVDQQKAEAREIAQSREEDPRVSELEDELTATREHLHTTIEELETANEELQSVNEELQSANEELQASNEELETANEELQSTNEELTTVNEELQVKSSELAEVNADLENILSRIGIALIIVDHGLRITRFTPQAGSFFALTSNDIGQVLTTIPTRIDLPNLRQDLVAVMAEEQLIERTVEVNSKIYLLRILPYLSEHRRVVGAMIMGIDRTDIAAAERELAHHNQTLRQNEQQLTMALQASGAGIYAYNVPIDADLYHSDRWAEILGYETSELPSYERFQTWWYQQIHRDDLAKWQAAYQAFVDGRVADYAVEGRLRHKNGGWRYVKDVAQEASRNEHQRVTRLVGVMIDITEQKEAERVLRQAHEALSEQVAYHAAELEDTTRRLHLIADNLPSWLSYVDEDQCYRYVNKMYENFWDMTADEIIGQHVSDVIGQQAYKRAQPYIEQALAGHAVRYENELTNRDGELIVVQASYVPHRIAGVVRGYIALVSDITAQKQIEMTLREQAELLDVAASRAESHVWMMQLSAFETADDQNGAIISQLQSILGLSDGHSAGTAANLSHRIPAEDQAQIRHSATRHLAGETDFHEVEYRLQHDDGEIHWIYSRGKLQRDEDGRPLRWLGVDWDITRWRGEIKE